MLTAAILSTLIAASSAVPADTSPQDQVREAVALADGMKTAVAYFASKSGKFPASNDEAGLPAPTLIHGRYVTSGTVSGSKISFKFGPGADRSLVSKHLVFEGSLTLEEGRSGNLTWTCKSEDIAQEACPISCACSGSSVQNNNVSLTLVRFDDHLQFQCAAEDAATASRVQWKATCSAVAAPHIAENVAHGTIAPVPGPLFGSGTASDRTTTASVPLLPKRE